MTSRNPRTSRRLLSTILPAVALPLLTANGAHAQAYTLTTLATFNGIGNGSAPYDPLAIDSSGNLYGTTVSGGANNDGTIFKIAAGTGALTTIATFNGTNGQGSYGGLTFDSSTNIYGVTSTGGANDDGTVFEIAAGTGSLTTLATFNDTNGRGSRRGVSLDSSGNLYGTTLSGGTTGEGTVFKIAAGTGTIATLATFNGSGNGANPFAGVTLDNAGNLYGTTGSGGANNDGTLFKIAAGTNALTTIVTFNGTNGADPLGNLTFDSSGNLYGTTLKGGTNGDGTLFKIAAGTGSITTLINFNGTNGSEPGAGVTFDSSGNLYGTTLEGGTNGGGTVFKIAAGTNTLTTLASFTGTANGQYPYASVTVDSSGNLYGTTYQGGANNYGTVFKLSPGGSAAAPEPATLALLLPVLFPILTLTSRRRKHGSRT